MLSAIRAARSMTKVASVPNPSLYTPDVAYRLHFYCNAPRYSGVSVPSCQTIASGFSYSLVSSPNFVWKVRDSNPRFAVEQYRSYSYSCLGDALLCCRLSSRPIFLMSRFFRCDSIAIASSHHTPHCEGSPQSLTSRSTAWCCVSCHQGVSL